MSCGVENRSRNMHKLTTRIRNCVVPCKKPLRRITDCDEIKGAQRIEVCF